MTVDLIPNDVRQFIVDKIDTVAELEGLLLLRKHPDTHWNTEELAERLYTSPQQAAEVLANLYSHGFLAVSKDEPTKYHYQPSLPNLADMVDRVAEIYSIYLIPVTNLIHSKPQTKVQQFADAFKFRTKEDK